MKCGGNRLTSKKLVKLQVQLARKFAKFSTEPLVVRSRNFNGSDYPVVRISTRLLSELVILLTVVEYGKNWTITMQKETAVTGR